MARETYSERKERVRQRDAIREFGFAVAEHTAGGEMVSFERRPDGEWPPLKFGRPIGVNRCECGMPMVPLPRFYKLYGALPCWYCVVCGLDQVVAACERVRQEVQPPEPVKARGIVA